MGDSWRSKRQKAQMDIGVSRRCAAPESGVMRHRAIGRGTAVAVRRVRVRGSSRAAGPRGRALPGSACASRGRVNDRRVRRDAEAEEFSSASASLRTLRSMTRLQVVPAAARRPGDIVPFMQTSTGGTGLATLVLLVESPSTIHRRPNDKIRVFQRGTYGLKDAEHLRLKVLTAYAAAKAGDAESAKRLVEDLLSAIGIDQIGHLMAGRIEWLRQQSLRVAEVFRRSSSARAPRLEPAGGASLRRNAPRTTTSPQGRPTLARAPLARR